MQNTGYPRFPRRDETSDRGRILFLIILVVALGAVYLAWLIPGVSSEAEQRGDHLLFLSGIISATVAFLNAHHFAAQRGGWLLIGFGSLSWSIAHFLRASTDVMSILTFTTAFLIAAISLVAGCTWLAGMGRGPAGFRQLGIDLIPPIIALVTAVWLIDIGPFVQQNSEVRHLALAAIAHGFSAVALVVVGLVGIASWQSLRTHPAIQSLMAGLAIIAIADALWLQRWIDRDQGFGIAADAAFCIGFVTIATGGLQARMTMRATTTPGAATEVISPRLTRHSAPFSLLLLLVLAGGQARWGELTHYGIEIAVSAGLTVLLFAMMWEDIVSERETVLTDEIGTLSERIDGLISQVGRDPLTGLLNRRAFQERLEYEIESGRATSQPVAIALIDVDNFKLVNDTLGHAVGDQVLQAVASILTGACRGSDVAARYAGDEFVMIFPGIDEQTAGQVAQRIIENVRQINDQLMPATDLRVTLSVGVAISHKCKRNVAQLIAIADAAMYDAKEAGKDRVIAIDADTLTIATWWGDDPATSATWIAKQAPGNRRAIVGQARNAI